MAVSCRSQAAILCSGGKDPSVGLSLLRLNDEGAAAFAVDGHALARMLCFDRAAADKRFGACVNDRHQRGGEGLDQQNRQRKPVAAALALLLAAFPGLPSDHCVLPSPRLGRVFLPQVAEICSLQPLD